MGAAHPHWRQYGDNSMRLASWNWGGRDHAGIISSDGREATPLALRDASRGVLPLIQALAQGEPLPPPSGARLPVDVITLRAPLPQPLRSLFCVGRNYHAHAAELAGTVFRETMPKEDPWPIVFTKLPECVVGPHDTVRLPGAAVSVQIDYESELAVVIGRGGRDISRSRAMDHVFGYTIVNDVTARDVQMRHQQWDLGKSFDTFCPMGPWIVTADEMDGRATRVRGWVNGALRQDGLTKDLIHGIETLVETCSRGITLYPGDVIATGTPAGVGMGLKPPQ
jgi:2-keto-4-pentenoate hydratase/2-oxohepta-3-ene-1,7-dioic acid hydratase in catechol pathway